MGRNFYDAGKYQTVRRKWFGLPKKFGGDAVSGGFTFGTHDPGTITHVQKWFPEGPIDIKKVGVFTASTSNNASGGGMNFQFLTRGASASVVATLKWASATQAGGVISASKLGSALTVTQCKAGEYVTIRSLEPTTMSATASEVKATTTGGAAFFIDYAPKFVYDADNWDRD
jgi:hypothetical protein